MFGLTMTEPGRFDVTCEARGDKFIPKFSGTMHSKIYILHKDHPAWDGPYNGNDDNIKPYWKYSFNWYKRSMVKTHEKKHVKHGKKNFDVLQAALNSYENNEFSDKGQCESCAFSYLLKVYSYFTKAESRDAAELDK